jgi:hypothetical protein
MIDRKQIISKLRAILDRADVDSDILSRKVSSKHNDETEILLEHVLLLVVDLRFNTEATIRELFEIRALLE